MVAAIKESAIGYQITFCIHCSQIARKPQRPPNASLVQTYTPPVLGQPVASSADTRADGIRKIKAAAKKKNTKENPSSAIRGRARRLAIITTFIIASANTPSIGFLPFEF